MKYQTSEECRDAGITYHMSPTSVWEGQKNRDSYLPEAFDQDGFIHATNGLEKLAWVGNEFYTGDRRPYIVLVLDVSKLTSPVRYDGPEELFPHIYGPLNTDAVIGELNVQRDAEGRFTDFTEIA
jgi:uncharacterized protein (DUF952 family)